MILLTLHACCLPTNTFQTLTQRLRKGVVALRSGGGGGCKVNDFGAFHRMGGGHLHLGVRGIDGFEMDGNSLCSVWLAPVLVGFAM